MTQHAAVRRHFHMPEDVRHAARTRLHLVQGQVGGLMRMVEDDRYRVDVLTQIASVREALRQVGRIVLQNYLQNCVAKAIHDGDDAVYDELMAVIDLFNRQG